MNESPATSTLPAAAEPQTKPNLIYTVIMDRAESVAGRFLGRMLVSSLLRTFFSGDILVFRNSPAPLFLVERKGVEEFYLETPAFYSQGRNETAGPWKYRVADLIENPEQYDKILFLEPDCLALRNADHLLEGDWDVRYQPEKDRPMNNFSFSSFLTEDEMPQAAARDGANGGILAIRGSRFREVIEAWRSIDEGALLREVECREQASWNATLLRGRACPPLPPLHEPCADGPAWKVEPFPAGEVQFPGWLDLQFTSYRTAALIRNIFPHSEQTTEFAFGLYMQTFFCDPTGVFLTLLET